jgi:RNA polymerase sigma-70 factor, ECF subfamily
VNIDTLYETYSRDVFRFALSLSGNWQDAEDITSETFVRAWVAEDSVRMATIKGYLFAIARNLFLKDVRTKSRHTELDESIADRRQNHPYEMEKREEYEAVLKRMQGLPEMDRAALLMRAYGQAPYGEIADALGISIGSAKVKVHRARAVLSAALEKTK